MIRRSRDVESAGISRRAALIGAGAGVGILSSAGVLASPVAPDARVRADGVDVFYREAGPAEAPVLLLLHGFTNSFFYFRHLMPDLAARFRLVAPDLPSFGFTEVPTERYYVYDFASLSRTIIAFVDALGLRRYGTSSIAARRSASILPSHTPTGSPGS